MITKKDWENALKQFEALLVNSQVNMAGYEYMVKHCEQKISEFPVEEEDPMPEEVKDILPGK